LIFENSKELQQSIEVTRSIIQRRIVVLCKTFEAITGGSGYVLSSYFYVLLNGGMVSGTLEYVICVGLKTLKRRKRLVGSRERLERPNPLEISSLSLMKKSMSYVVIEQDLGGLWLMPV
jgi:hypothetical protein